MPKTSIRIWALVVVACLAANLPRTEGSFAITVLPSNEECVVVRTPKKEASIVSGDFDIMDDYDDADYFSMTVENADTGETLYTLPPDTTEGKFSFDNLPMGIRLLMCFRNRYSNDDEENKFAVGFNVRVTKLQRALDGTEFGPDGERANQLVKRASAVLENWAVLRDHFDFLRNREAVHIEKSDSIIYRLERWTLTEAFIVIAMATFQVMYWKKFFEKKRYI